MGWFKDVVKYVDNNEAWLVLEGDEILNLWEGFKKVVKFIDNNGSWLDGLMGIRYLYKTNK